MFRSSIATLLVFLGSAAIGSPQECRGTNGHPGTTNPPSAPRLQCAGTCTSPQDECKSRNGANDWAGFKICNCDSTGPGSTPSGCCQLALERIAPGSNDYKLVLIGDCISCDEPLATCDKLIGASGGWTPICLQPPPTGG
jgi:hypothetical protein